MKYLLTGGAGFVGSNIAADLLKRNEELLVFDNLFRQGSEQNLIWLQEQGEFWFENGDVRDTAILNKIVREFKPDVVFHLAGQVAMTTSIADPRLDFEINALGTFNLLEAVRQFASEAIVIYSSTNKVYGDLEQYTYRETSTRYECIEKPEGFDESTPLDFHSPYGTSNGAADQYMLDYARVFDLKTVVFRHSSMYGNRQFPTYDQGWIGWFCEQAQLIRRSKLEKPLTISGNGKQVRDVLHVEDVIRLYSAVVEHIDEVVGEALNIGGGITNSLSLLELFQLIECIISIKMEFSQISPRISDQKVFVADITKVRALLKWEPSLSPIDGITQILV